MFYSQTFLARKGRLSTVWIAAHLQHRLKKSQYTSTDIPSTVQHIMDPGVPISLRMSAHLLLGVVRIYSKKVDYLLNDCNIVRTVLYKVFAVVSNHTLPEDGMQAPLHTITMPATFDLDALNLSYGMDVNGYEDHHMKSLEDITLADENPTVLENYVTIRFDEDTTFSSPNTQLLPDSDARPIEEDIIPQSPLTIGADFQDVGPSSHTESHATDHTVENSVPSFMDPITEQAIPVENNLRYATNDYATNYYDAIENLQNSGHNDIELTLITITLLISIVVPEDQLPQPESLPNCDPLPCSEQLEDIRIRDVKPMHHDHLARYDTVPNNISGVCLRSARHSLHLISLIDHPSTKGK
ncbi:unnamed protein product [Lathyrus sativus]|nr:unnamed protein product [Lathyrus sativus]